MNMNELAIHMYFKIWDRRWMKMISLYLDDLLVSASYHYHQDMVYGWDHNSNKIISKWYNERGRDDGIMRGVGMML